jgi:hypothetical protein
VKDYYEILQVSPNAEPEVIASAYRRLARKYHPDAYAGRDATERMRELNEAYEVLSDPARRAEYDRARQRTRREAARARSEAPSQPRREERAAPAERTKTPAAKPAGRRPLLVGLALIGLALLCACAAIGIWIGIDTVRDSDGTSLGIGLAQIWKGPAGPTSCWTVDLGAQAQCIVNEAEASGAPKEAVAFFWQHAFFLGSFEEEGRVDWGLLWHPIYNQTRPEPAFLNGPLPVLTVRDALGDVKDLVPEAVTYVEGILAYTEGAEGALMVWPEYSSLKSVIGGASGQTFVVSIPLKQCRACPTERELVAGFVFDGAGNYLGRGLARD